MIPYYEVVYDYCPHKWVFLYYDYDFDCYIVAAWYECFWCGEIDWD